MATDLLSTICGEIDERLNELRPLLAEQQRLLVAADALLEARQGGGEGDRKADEGSVARLRAADERPVKRPRRSAAKPKPKPKPERAVRGAAREAILGALEHGSHTVSELAVVTAMSGPNINGHLRRLVTEGVVVKAEREGKVAWALANPVS
jgi:DNA-binding transcriptional ArsR family regulator